MRCQLADHCRKEPSSGKLYRLLSIAMGVVAWLLRRYQAPFGEGCCHVHILLARGCGSAAVPRPVMSAEPAAVPSACGAFPGAAPSLPAADRLGLGLVQPFVEPLGLCSATATPRHSWKRLANDGVVCTANNFALSPGKPIAVIRFHLPMAFRERYPVCVAGAAYRLAGKAPFPCES